MSAQGNIPYAIFQNECYYVAKGVRKIALWDCKFLHIEELNEALKALQHEIDYWRKDTFASHKLNWAYLIKERTSRTGQYKFQWLYVVIYKDDDKASCLEDADWLLKTITAPHGEEEVRRIGLLLGYTPELVEQFIKGRPPA